MDLKSILNVELLKQAIQKEQDLAITHIFVQFKNNCTRNSQIALGFASCNYLTVTGTIIPELHSNVCDYLYKQHQSMTTYKVKKLLSIGKQICKINDVNSNSHKFFGMSGDIRFPKNSYVAKHEQKYYTNRKEILILIRLWYALIFLP